MRNHRLASLFHGKIWLLFCSHCYYTIQTDFRTVSTEWAAKTNLEIQRLPWPSLILSVLIWGPWGRVCRTCQEALHGDRQELPVLSLPYTQPGFQGESCIYESYVLRWCAIHKEISQWDKRAICHPRYLLKRLRWPTHIIVFSLLHSPAVSWGSGYWSAGNAVPPLWHELKLSKHWPWWGVFWCNWTEKHQELDSDPIKSQFGQWYN